MKGGAFIAISIIFLAACRQQQPVGQLLEINNALEKANFIIKDNSLLAYEEMAGKSFDPRTYYAAKIWEPKARVIRQCVSEVKLVIDKLKSVLIEKSDSLQNLDRAIVQQVLSADGNAGRLFEKLILLKDSAAVTFENVKELNRDSVFFNKSVIQIGVAGYSKADWVKKNFDNCSPLLAVMALNKIEANVLLTEHILVTHCNMSVVYNFCGYYSPSPIAFLNSSVVKSGDTIMVTAGVGVFDREICPRITINGTRLKLYESPVARYEFIATGKPGTYTLPIKIEYMDIDGSRKTASRDLGYIIAEDK